MSSRRSLPGFLRRAQREKYDDEDASSDDESANDEAENLEDALEDQKEQTSTTQLASEATLQPSETPIVSNEPSEHSLIEDRKDLQLSDQWQHLPPENPPPVPERKLSYHQTVIEAALNNPIVNLSELRKLGWNGVPAVHRGTAWKLLLGYWPVNSARRSTTISRRRRDYQQAVAQHYDIPDDSRTLQEQEVLRQVLVDVPRTAPTVALFRNERIRRILTRLLYIWAMRHPASSYVQGINDLATPLVTVFLADHFQGSIDVLDGHVMNHFSDDDLFALEADVYGCLTNLLAGIQDHYTADQPGIQRMMARLEELVNRIDVDLCEHFRNEGLRFLEFAFQWMNCLLLRQFTLPCVLRLWDTYLSEEKSFEDFHVYVCAAFLCQYSAQLRTMSFEDLFEFFQNVPTNDWTDTEIEVLLSQAYVLSTLFGDSEAHLTSSSGSIPR